MSVLKKLFKKQKSLGLIFIVEDNELYAKALEFFLKEKFPNTEIKCFPVGELCTDQLHLNPDLIIMDYFLNSKYYDAVDGLEIIRQIKSKKPNSNIVLLSEQNKIDVIVNVEKEIGRNNYITKDKEAFKNIELIIRALNGRVN